LKKTIIIFSLLFIFAFSLADTHIPAGNVNGVWTFPNSPYIIDGEISIQMSDDLTIQPGVDVIFNGHYKFIIYGKLLAQGTVADSILFTVADTTGFSNFNSTDGSWHGLRFMSNNFNGQENSILNHCSIEYAKTPHDTGSNAERQGGGIYINLSSNLEITNCEISNNIADYGGGIYCCESSPILSGLTIKNNYGRYDAGGVLFSGEDTDTTLENSIIKRNSCVYNGGGIFCSSGSAIVLNNVIIKENSTTSNYPDDQPGGGGISCWHSSIELNDVVITNNISNYNGIGGGIECGWDSEIILNNCQISNNEAREGGGVHNQSSMIISGTTIHNNTAFGYAGGFFMGSISTTILDPDNRCSIYLNNSISASTTAHDLYNINSDILMNVIVDTFTVMHPNVFFACQMDNFTFDILNCSLVQLESDVFVSPEGSNDNSGLSPQDPFLNISHAYKMLNADSLNSLTIYLDNGTYSISQTGERFGICCRSYISIVGTDQNSTILDGEGSNRIFMCNNVSNLTLKNMMFQNSGQPAFGSSHAVSCYDTNVNLENLTIHGITSSFNQSAAILTGSDIFIRNVSLYNNEIGIFCHYSSPKIINSTIYNYTGNQFDEGIYVYHSNPVIVNSIIWNISNINNGIYVYGYGTPSTVTISNTDVLGGEACISLNNNGTLNWLEGNIDEDPLFTDPINGNFHLSENSPCIDAGTDYFEWQGNIIVNMTPDEYYGPAPDMGAYEWEGVNNENQQIIPIINKLYQNYPNPFNPSTTISFSLPVEENIEVAVYNLKGQKVKTITKGEFDEGNYSVIWNGDDESGKPVSSGVYFYKFKTESGDYTSTKKMLLMK